LDVVRGSLIGGQKNSRIESKDDEHSCLKEDSQASSLDTLQLAEVEHTSSFEDSGLGIGLETSLNEPNSMLIN
jgi:hypothetical protein